MEILNSFQDQFGVALTMTGLHSIWMGVLLFAITSIMIRSEIVKGARQLYALHLSALGLLFFGSIVCFNFYYQPSIVIPSTEMSSLMVMEYSLNQSGFEYNIPHIFSLIWVVGLIMGLTRLFVGYFKLNQLKIQSVKIGEEWIDQFNHLMNRMKLTQKVRLKISKYVSIPMVVGHLKPVIILPLSYLSNLSPIEVECILVHELAHIKRYDYFVNLMQCMAETILFFNPATWWFSTQIRKYREYCCDDEVQRYVRNKESYLKALYKVADQSMSSYPLSIALTNSKSDLVMRIKRILNSSNEKRTLLSLWKPIIVSMIVFSFFAFQIDQKEKNDEKLTPIENVDVEVPIVSEIESIPEIVVEQEPVLAIQPVEILIDEVAPVVAIEPFPIAVEAVPAVTLLSPTMIISPQPFVLYAPPVVITPMMIDTSKRSKKARKLEQQIEKKSKELEELSKKWEQEVGAKYELKAKEYEELAFKLNNEFKFKFDEMEWKSEEFEEKMEALGKKLETQLELNLEPMMNFKWENEEFEAKIEAIAKEMEEKYGDQSNAEDWSKEDRDRFNSLMKKLQ